MKNSRTDKAIWYTLFMFFSTVCCFSKADTRVEPVYYDMLARELKHRLSQSDRFTLLPGNMNRICIRKNHVPRFIVPYGKTSLCPWTTILESASRDHEAFGLVIGGRVAGTGSRGEWILSKTDGKQAACITPEAPKSLTLPKSAKLIKAYQISDRWFYLTDAGILDSNGQWLKDELPASLKDSVQIVTPEECVFVQTQTGRSTKEYSVDFVIQDANEMQVETFLGPPISTIDGAIRLNNGSWLGIGRKLAVLTAMSRNAPGESELVEALAAAEQKDEAEFARHLERLTCFPSNHLGGLATLLKEMPDPLSDLELEQTTQQVKGLSSRIESWQKKQISSQHKATQKQVDRAMYELRQDLERFVSQVSRIPTNDLLTFPSETARFLEQGYQYFDAWWIRYPKLLLQTTLHQALVQMSFIDPHTRLAREGVFRVRHTGSIEMVCILEGVKSTYRPDCHLIQETKGKYYLLITGYGLARITDKQFAWLDQSERMKSMTRAHGIDKHGRLYFSHAQVNPISTRSRKDVFWVYRPGKTPRKARPLRVIGAGQTAVMDTKQRLWFLHNDQAYRRIRISSESGSLRNVESHLIHDIDSMLEEAASVELTGFSAGPATNTAFPNSSSIPTLYCHQDNEFTRFFSHSSLKRAALLAGSNGSLFILPESHANPTFVIDYNKVVQGADLHTLAQNQFDYLYRSAPERALPALYRHGSTWQYGPFHRGAICKTEDLLWVAQNNQIEVYKEGHPLHIHKRLTLIGVTFKHSQIYGPMHGQPRTMLLVPDHTDVTNIFWATASDKGISLKRGTVPLAWPTNANRDARRIEGLPLLDRQSHSICFYSDLTILQKNGVDQDTCFRYIGRPKLFTKAGDLIIYRTSPYEGYCLHSEGKQVDIIPTYVDPLRIIHERSDGRLICSSPEGLVWLKTTPTRQYSIEKTEITESLLYPHTYIGQADNRCYYLADDRTRKTYVVSHMEDE